MNSSFDQDAGSAVMPTAMVVVDLDWLLDELELRLTRCVYDVPTMTIGRRVGASLAAGESLHRAAEFETQTWWEEHGLAEADDRVYLKILTVLLERSPQFLAWGAVPLLTKYLMYPLDWGFVNQLVAWVTEPEPADRMIRDAIGLNILAPWLLKQSVVEVNAAFRTWCKSKHAPTIRLGLTAMASYVRRAESLRSEVTDSALGACWSLAAEVDPDTAISVGWLLKEMLDRDGDRVMPHLTARIHELSRQAMRTATERLPHDQRTRLTSSWLSKRPRRWSHLRSTGTRAIRTRL